MGSFAQCDCVAEDCLDASQPCGAGAKVINRHFWGIIKKRGAKKGCFSAERLGSAAFDDLLVLLFRKPQLPRYPANGVAWYEPAVHNAEEAYARHGVGVQMLAGVIPLEIFNQLCNAS